jgi:large subunit ribosomal protein L46
LVSYSIQKQSTIALLITVASGSICKSCRENLQRRTYAQAAAAIAEEPSVPPVQAASIIPRHEIRAGIVLSRPPLITRDLTSFEKAYFLYQRRLNERTALPFTRYFYYAKGTPGEQDWKKKIKTRLTPARDIGRYHAYGREGWNDEVLMGAPESEPDYQMQKLVEDAETNAMDEMLGKDQSKPEFERPMPRETEADRKGDTKSLDRLQQRSLYLLIKDSTGKWLFPHATVGAKEHIHSVGSQ